MDGSLKTAIVVEVAPRRWTLPSTGGQKRTSASPRNMSSKRARGAEDGIRAELVKFRESVRRTAGLRASPPASRGSTNMSDADLSTTNNACRPSIRAWISLTVVCGRQGVAERGFRCAGSVVSRFFSAGMGPSDSFHRRPTVHGSDGGSRSKRGRNESARGAMPPWIAGGDH